jgi:hypothetical protein
MLQAMIFLFYGSAHTKYGSYILEFMVSLELEMSPEACLAILKNWLIGLKGEPGHKQHLDMLVEHLILLLDNTTRHCKNAAYDSLWVRNVLSSNLTHLQSFTADWLGSVDLAAKKGHHPEPSSDPDIRELLDLYRTTQLHRFRSSRSYAPGENTQSTVDLALPATVRSVNDFARGMERLQTGHLRKWIDDSTWGCNLATSGEEQSSDTPIDSGRTFELEFERLEGVPLEGRPNLNLAEDLEDDSDSSHISGRRAHNHQSQPAASATLSDNKHDDSGTDSEANNDSEISSSASSSGSKHEECAVPARRWQISFGDGRFCICEHDDTALKTLATRLGELEEDVEDSDSDDADTDVDRMDE